VDRQFIEDFAAGASKPRQAVAGLNEKDLHARPGPGDWSIHELVIHLADSDGIGIDRMKRIIAEENPSLLNYDETAYIARLHCDAQSLEDALTLFEVGRRQFARVLRRLPDETFDRFGTHNVQGRLTLTDLVQGYAGHLDHHLEFLYAKRERLGKPSVGGKTERKK
jgi:hypothetical protein